MTILMRTEAREASGGLARWVPRLLAGTAAVHLVFGVVAGSDALADMAGEGFVNTIKGDAERESWLWFLLTGVAWAGLAGLTRRIVDDTGRVPTTVGATLMATAVPLTVVEPASGGWIVAAVGALALVASRRGA